MAVIEVALAKSQLNWYVTVLYCIVGVGTCATNTEKWGSQEREWEPAHAITNPIYHFLVRGVFLYRCEWSYSLEHNFGFFAHSSSWGEYQRGKRAMFYVSNSLAINSDSCLVYAVDNWAERYTLCVGVENPNVEKCTLHPVPKPSSKKCNH